MDGGRSSRATRPSYWTRSRRRSLPQGAGEVRLQAACLKRAHPLRSTDIRSTNRGCVDSGLFSAPAGLGNSSSGNVTSYLEVHMTQARRFATKTLLFIVS